MLGLIKKVILSQIIQTGDNINFPAVIITEDQYIEHVNKLFLDTFYLTHNQILGKNLHSFVDEISMDTNSYSEIFSLENSDSLDGKLIVTKENRSYIYRNLVNEADNMLGVFIETDFTSQLKHAVKNSLKECAMFDRELNYIISSDSWLHTYGLNVNMKDIKGKNHYEIFPEIRQEWKTIHIKCLSGETIRNERDVFLREDGTIQYLKWMVKPWYKNTEIGGVIMITEKLACIEENEALIYDNNILRKRIKYVEKLSYKIDYDYKKGMEDLKLLKCLFESTDDFNKRSHLLQHFHQSASKLYQELVRFSKIINEDLEKLGD